MSAATEARDEAMQRVERHADDKWKRWARYAVNGCAAVVPTFTTDDVWGVLDGLGIEAPHEPRALGPIILRAAREGIIEPTGVYVRSSRPECHARPIAQYRSLVR